MDNSPVDPTLYDTTLPLGLDNLPSTPTPTNGSMTGPVVGVPNPAYQPPVAPELSNANILGNLGKSLTDIVPGLGAIGSLVSIVESVIADIATGVKDVQASHPLGIIESVLKNIGAATTIFDMANINFAHWMSDHQIGNPFSDYLSVAIGANVAEFTTEENAAVKGIDRMLGFALGMQMLSMAVSAAGEGLFANRWGKGIAEALKDIPNELGLSWVLGLTIEESFKAAQGVVLEEAINKQFHGNRIQWPQVRLLLKQHVIDDPTYQALLDAQGFDETQRGYLSQLQDIQIPVGDVAQLWYRDDLSDADALKKIQALGFSDTDAELIYHLYVDKSENQATATYHSIARQMFVAHIITEDMYRTALDQANFPKKLIDADIASITLEQELGRVLNSVSVIKQRYQHGIINDQQATQDLQELNYAPEFITELLQAWALPPLRRQHGLSQAKILSYYVSGVLKRTDAEPQLLATGLSPEATTFLLDNPIAHPGVRQHARTPALVTQAYVDGVITPATLADALASAGVSAADMAYYKGIAEYKLSHKRGGPGAVKDLTEAQIVEAWHFGLMHQVDAIGMLEKIGYSSEDALLLLEIKNKGPIQAQQPPAFATVQDAVTFLQQLGYVITNGPDPRIAQAEVMVDLAGYQISGPASLPPNLPVPPGPSLPPTPIAPHP